MGLLASDGEKRSWNCLVSAGEQEEHGTYRDGVDGQDGDLGGKVVQLAVGTGLCECPLDEVRQVGWCL